MEIKKIWSKILCEIEQSKQITALSFDVWIKPIEPICVYKNTLVLCVITEATLNLILKRYREIIREATRTCFTTIVDVEFILEEQVELYSKYIDQTVNIKTPIEDTEVKIEPPSFVENFTFDNFVVGKSNEFATAASRAVAERPGSKYNPLFLYGGVGLGKTHLMHAIGNYLKENNKKLNVIYVSAERFSNDLLDAIRDSSVNRDAKKQFRNKYRSVDCLMIDDIQFIAKLSATQEEVFHTFNDLYLQGKQIIISSDRPPKEIAPLEERLRTRFESGLVADISQPDIELRIAILQKVCTTENVRIDTALLRVIAERVTSNIRDLKGLFTRVVSYASLTNRDCNDLKVVEEALKDYADDSKEIITLERIVEQTCEYYSITKADLIGKKRNKEIVTPRQVCVYLITEFLSMPLVSIGEYFGGRDYTTMIHSRDKISEQIKENGYVEQQVKDIKAAILNK